VKMDYYCFCEYLYLTLSRAGLVFVTLVVTCWTDTEQQLRYFMGESSRLYVQRIRGRIIESGLSDKTFEERSTRYTKLTSRVSHVEVCCCDVDVSSLDQSYYATYLVVIICEAKKSIGLWRYKGTSEE
jgi:hypothetical protein